MDNEPINTKEMIEAQADIWKIIFRFVDSMALKSAVELRIPDIIHSHSQPITLRHIISSLSSGDTKANPTVGPAQGDITSLGRLMRLLVHRKIFTVGSDGGETVYGPTHRSRWLLRDTSEFTLAPMITMTSDEVMLTSWLRLSDCVREGGPAFNKAHGLQFWEYGSQNPRFSKIFNDAMECTAKITVRAILEGYKDGFDLVGSVVDVGGGTGAAIAAIVEANSRIVGINFDLPHVIATAPEYLGVSHIGGDMFTTIPKADLIFMKWVLHDWNDEDCVRILKNCHEAIPEFGKVVIVDIVLSSEGDDLFDDTRLVYDLEMMAHLPGGKERNELEWKQLIDEAGFSRMNIIKIAALPSIIEAYY